MTGCFHLLSSASSLPLRIATRKSRSITTSGEYIICDNYSLVCKLNYGGRCDSMIFCAQRMKVMSLIFEVLLVGLMRYICVISRSPLTICLKGSPGKAAPGFGIGALEESGSGQTMGYEAYHISTEQCTILMTPMSKK